MSGEGEGLEGKETRPDIFLVYSQNEREGRKRVNTTE